MSEDLGNSNNLSPKLSSDNSQYNSDLSSRSTEKLSPKVDALTGAQESTAFRRIIEQLRESGGLNVNQANNLIEQVLAEVPDTFDAVDTSRLNQELLPDPRLRNKVDVLKRSKLIRPLLVGVTGVLLLAATVGLPGIRQVDKSDSGQDRENATRPLDPDLIRKKAEDLIGKAVREWFDPRETKPGTRPIFIPGQLPVSIPEMTYGPAMPGEIEKRYRLDSIEMDNPGESIGGWGDKVAVMYSNLSVAKHQLEYAASLGIPVMDPNRFVQIASLDPDRGRRLLANELRIVERSHAGLPDKDTKLQAGFKVLRETNPELLVAFREKIADSALANNAKPLGPNNDQLTGEQTWIRLADKLFEEAKQTAEERRALQKGVR